MSEAKIVLCVAAGVVLGGLCLCGIGSLLLGRSPLAGRPSEESAAAKDRRHRYRLFEIRQIGLAALQYSNDHDDLLPVASTVRDALIPYIRKNDLGAEQDKVVTDLRNIEWLLPPVSQTSLEDIGHREMATLSDKDGKAVVYADGHGRWLDAPTP